MKTKFILLFISIVLVTGRFSAATFESINQYNDFFQKAYVAYPAVPKGILEAIAFSNTRIEHIVHDSLTPESCTGIPKAYGVMGLTLDGKNYFRNNLKYVSQLSGIDEQTIISAFSDVDNALAQYRNANEENLVRAHQAITARRALSLTRARYDFGYSSYYEVLIQENYLFEA